MTDPRLTIVPFRINDVWTEPEVVSYGDSEHNSDAARARPVVPEMQLEVDCRLRELFELG